MFSSDRFPSFPFVRVPIEKSYTDFQTAGLTNTLNILVLPADVHILGLQMEVITAFSGTTTMTLTLGQTGTENAYITAEDSKTTGIKNATLGAQYVFGKMVYTTALTIVSQATATVENLSSLTAGLVRYTIIYTDNT